MEEAKLSPDLVTRDLNTSFIGQKVIYFPSVESTMDTAKKEALWGAEAGTVIITDDQTAGRGRLQRTWLSPTGGLALSIVLRPNMDYLPYMVMMSSLAVAYSIQKITGLKPQIKWPNDVLIKDKKVCGILIENDIRKNALKSMVIGIGINVNTNFKGLPELDPIATSLSDNVGKEVSRLEILRQILIELDNLYKLLPDTEAIFQQWKKLLITLGQKVQVHFIDSVHTGTVESVTHDGNLMLRQADGSLMKIIAGDVSLRGPRQGPLLE